LSERYNAGDISMATDRYASTGIHCIDHFALNQPDLGKSEHFARAFGLRVERADDELRLRTASADHVWARIFVGAKKSLAYLSLGCYEQDLAALKAQITAAGGASAHPHARAEQTGSWFHDPDGNLLQIKVAQKTMPDGKATLPNDNVPAGVRGVKGRSAAAKVEPRRLSHVLLFTPDVNRALDFYRRGVGLNLSDRSGDVIAFMHARHGCDHHLIALALSPGKGFHHSSWDVPGIEDVGLGAMQMRAAGYAHQWGVGHHVLGSNYFDYVRDPGCAWWEYSAHIDYVPAGAEWKSGDFPPEDSVYLWGPDLPADFIENSELQAK
jgi:catechol 2,3-dioxygenase-like lactoylglutathione lyase family enzyme